MIGIGAMISELGGNEESVKAYMQAKDKQIKAVTMTDDILHLEMEDGYRIGFYDDGQSCCEHRYLTTDDNLEAYAGATLISAEVAEGPDLDTGGESHETAFLRVHTSKGTIAVCSHNEHNGYYGGISIRVKQE